MKGEWVTQKYKDFASTLVGTATPTAPDARFGGKFNGYAIEDVQAFKAKTEATASEDDSFAVLFVKIGWPLRRFDNGFY